MNYRFAPPLRYGRFTMTCGEDFGDGFLRSIAEAGMRSMPVVVFSFNRSNANMPVQQGWLPQVLEQ